MCDAPAAHWYRANQARIDAEYRPGTWIACSDEGEVVWYGSKLLDGFVQHAGCFFTRVGYGSYGTADDLDWCLTHVVAFGAVENKRPLAECTFSVIKKFGAPEQMVEMVTSMAVFDTGADSSRGPLEVMDIEALEEGVRNRAIIKELVYEQEEDQPAVYSYQALAYIAVKGTTETFRAPITFEAPEVRGPARQGAVWLIGRGKVLSAMAVTFVGSELADGWEGHAPSSMIFHTLTPQDN